MKYLLGKCSIRRKFILLLSAIASLAVLTASFVFYLQIIKTYNASYQRNSTERAAILGGNCTAALTFFLPDDATNVLNSLKADASVIAARILDQNGKVFASYGGYRQDGFKAEKTAITVSEKITHDGKVIGTIELVDDMSHLHEFKEKVLLSLAMILAVVLICSIFLAKRLCTLITTPLHDLSTLASTIAYEQNYQLRATVTSDDEVGTMATAFNTMLERIDHKTRDLISSEHRFRTLIEQGVDAFFLHDENGHLVDVNQTACDSLDYSREELLSMTVADIDGESVSRQDRENFWQQLVPGATATLTSHHKRRDGALIPVEIRLGILVMDGKRFVMGLARDISRRLAEQEELHNIEMQLQQAQKMESIGTLAGGIAHDFNNILSAVIGFTDLTMMLTKDNPTVQENLTHVRKAADRAASLVKQIPTFSRKQQQEKTPMQISLVVKEALKLLRASIPSTIKIKQDIDTDGTVLADPTQIHQLIMNLCTNAYHAMLDSGGVLSISLHEIVINQALVDCGVELPSGHYLKLSVSDSGCGISPEIMAKIFEPYFTTKEKERGTGLGLAVVHGIVKGHHGRIAVYSEPGHGTTFNIYLPMIAQSGSADAMPTLTLPRAKSNERIMLVDDEPLLRDTSSQFLRWAGYRVDLFANGAEAWTALSQTPDAWDLLITDQTMPEMTGAQLTVKARQLRPTLPIIICSGFSETLDPGGAMVAGANAFLQKPVSLETLLTRINTLLEGATNPSAASFPCDNSS